jgi:3-phenylpropionate/cinnamic acid dioxygenase small subunit
MVEEMAALLLHRAIEAKIIGYAKACDEADWARLDDIIDEHVEVSFDDQFALPAIAGRQALVTTLRSVRDQCSATHHLAGNVWVSDRRGDEVESHFHLRAFHRGQGIHAEGSWDVMGEYRDLWIMRPEGWRVLRRHYLLRATVGRVEDILGGSLAG